MTNSNADGKHIRLPQKPYAKRIGELDKEEVPNEEGKADPAESGSAGGEPRHEVSPSKSSQRTARRTSRGCPGARRDFRGGGTRLVDPEVEEEDPSKKVLEALTLPKA